MTQPEEEWRAVYIDGVLRAGVMERGTLYVDSDALPYRRCSAIKISQFAWARLVHDGGSVHTSGVTISLTPPRAPRFVRPPQKPLTVVLETKPRSLLSKLVTVIKEHYK